VLKNILTDSGLDERDAAFASRLCYGVIQNEILIDYYISVFSSVKVKKIQPIVLDIIRLGIYQLLFMDKIPPSATVNEGVKLAKRHANQKAGGFVNAVLRRASTCDKPPDIKASGKKEYLSIKYSHPYWLVEKFVERLGYDETEKLLEFNNIPAPLTIQTNTLKITVKELTERLEKQSVKYKEHPLLTGCFELWETGSPDKLDIFREGCIMIQDAAAYLSVIAAKPVPGESVLDICAAPGGKSFATAIMMNNKGSVVSNDLYPHKVKLIESGATRLGIKIINANVYDALRINEGYRDRFDLVIADVPCSGLGIIRKKPDIRYKDPLSLKELPDIQSMILKNASLYVKPGGALLYSTCTLLKEENEDIVNVFLQNNPEFSLQAFTLPGIGEIDGQITMWPHKTGTDGFYFARVRRRG
jgi:16S rRNA (cytosine967-C5)-methyltransferase